jgi:hypothetical protein
MQHHVLFVAASKQQLASKGFELAVAVSSKVVGC